MSPFQRQLLITVVMAGVAGFAGVWFAVSRLDPAAERAPPAPLRLAVDELTRRGLVGLTAQQKQSIDVIEQRYAHQRVQLRTRIASANFELANSLAEEMSLGPSVEKSIDDLKSAVGDLQRATVVYVLDLRAVLTPQQQGVFDEKVVAALMTDPR